MDIDGMILVYSLWYKSLNKEPFKEHLSDKFHQEETITRAGLEKIVSKYEHMIYTKGK